MWVLLASVMGLAQAADLAIVHAEILPVSGPLIPDGTVLVEDGRITGFAQDVKACALGQASASVVGAHIIGRTRAEVETARDQLNAMLKGNGPVPDAPFDGLEVLLPATEYKNRHASILLALDATLDAFDAAAKTACA